MESWQGAQGQGPTIDWCLFIGDQGWCLRFMVLSQARYIYLWISCNYAINRIPQLAMYCNVKEMGAWFHKEKGGGIIQTLILWGKSMCQNKTPKNVCPFPHAFTFSSSLMFLESGWTFYIIHPSFTWSSQEAEPSWVFILHVFSFSS